MTRAVFLLAFLTVLALFPLREWAVTGTVRFLPTGAALTYTTQTGAVLERSPWDALTGLVLPNVAFLAGYLPARHPEYMIRPHWLLLWGLYGLWWWRWLFPRREQFRRRVALWEPWGAVLVSEAEPRAPMSPTLVVLHLYVASYLLVMLPNAWIGGYGYRYVVPLFFVLVLVGVGAVTPRRQSR